MRLVYQNGKLYISATTSEVDDMYWAKGGLVELDIGYLRVLHDDINNAVSEYWRDIEYPIHKTDEESK